ncbi:MAG: putative toxin-antitoxin system toxin component, PIN family [Bryobacteraceae bacterium]|jgi:putative PIN family toxin of toxin-antitoxin system
MSLAPGAARLKAVLDTNVYISAFQCPKGRNVVLWDAALAGRFRLIVSPAIIQEMAGVLRADFNWPEDRVQNAVRIVARVAGKGIVMPHARVHVVAADPDDDRILECAVDGKADLIVSNDHHLLDLKEYSGIPIVRSVDFRRALELK